MSKKDCCSCVKYRSGFCSQWKVSIPETTVAQTCGKFNEIRVLNKGLQIRQNKLNKQARKRGEAKEEQIGVVCFVDYSEKIIERINGKYRHPTRTERGKGLQIENKIYLANGHHKMINRSTLKITKIYDNIPPWASQSLIELYQKHLTPTSSTYSRKTLRKSCKTCVHFKFSETQYYCEVTGSRAEDYNHKEYCSAPRYQRKKSTV